MARKSFPCKIWNSNEEANPGAGLDLRLPPLTNRLEAMRRSSARRQISRESGRALEILGHAIEYLADEYVLRAARTGTLGSDDPCIDAMHVLMLLNREVYYACPEVEGVLPRIAQWLSRPPVSPRRRLN